MDITITDKVIASVTPVVTDEEPEDGGLPDAQPEQVFEEEEIKFATSMVQLYMVNTAPNWTYEHNDYRSWSYRP